jgi:hypothetical protein
MSHITTIKTELKDGRILRSILLKLGYHVKEGGVITGGYGGRRETVDMLATIRGQTIGFRRSGSALGPYEIFADWCGDQKARDRVVSDIFQTYSQEKVIQSARLRGYSVIKNQRNQNGQIEMILRKVA